MPHVLRKQLVNKCGWNRAQWEGGEGREDVGQIPCITISQLPNISVNLALLLWRIYLARILEE